MYNVFNRCFDNSGFYFFIGINKGFWFFNNFVIIFFNNVYCFVDIFDFKGDIEYCIFFISVFV